MSEPRVAVVTGASSGIGRAVAIALGALGWRVALGARGIDKLDETAALVIEAGGEACPRALDVTDAASVDEFVDTVEDAMGPIDVLVNNAGIAIPGVFWELAPDELDREVRTNLLGPLLCTRRVLPSMIQGHRGDVVFIPAGEKHWHGATATSAMTHAAVAEALDGKSVDWMEKVSDEQYRK